MHNRREFLIQTFGAAAGAMLLGRDALAAVTPAPVPKRILILGGTGFIGPHQVHHALARGHQVTIFNRGRTAPGLFDDRVEQLIGDRANNLASLRGHRWDAVIDNSAASAATAPEWVKLSAEALRDSVDQYLFISTRSAYRDTSRVPMTADAPTLTMADLRPGQTRTYGVAKAMAEREALAALPGRVTIVRPGLIIGPGDQTDRFTYWPVRVARGGDVLVPGDGSDHVQIIDVRDLDEWLIRLIEDRAYGAFNAVGPQMGRPFRNMIAAIHAGVGGTGRYTWVDTDFLIANDVRPYSAQLPVFMPMRGATAGFARFDLTPELRAGLTFRPMEVTARETLEWFRTLPAERQAGMRTGLSPDREAQLLAAWRARS